MMVSPVIDSVTDGVTDFYLSQVSRMLPFCEGKRVDVQAYSSVCSGLFHIWNSVFH